GLDTVRKQLHFPDVGLYGVTDEQIALSDGHQPLADLVYRVDDPAAELSGFHQQEEQQDDRQHDAHRHEDDHVPDHRLLQRVQVRSFVVQVSVHVLLYQVRQYIDIVNQLFLAQVV